MPVRCFVSFVSGFRGLLGCDAQAVAATGSGGGSRTTSHAKQRTTWCEPAAAQRHQRCGCGDCRYPRTALGDDHEYVRSTHVQRGRGHAGGLGDGLGGGARAYTLDHGAQRAHALKCSL